MTQEPTLFSFRPLAVWPFLAALPLLAGCIGFIPVPMGKEPLSGPALKRQDTAFIRPGHTTREEVIAHLGTNYAAQPFRKAIAYTWEGYGVRVIGWVVLVGPYGCAAGAGETEWGTWHGFLVAFDRNGVVRASAFKRLSPGRSLHEHLDRWVSRLPPRTVLPE